jgi:hypothetical protein
MSHIPIFNDQYILRRDKNQLSSGYSSSRRRHFVSSARMLLCCGLSHRSQWPPLCSFQLPHQQRLSNRSAALSITATTSFLKVAFFLLDNREYKGYMSLVNKGVEKIHVHGNKITQTDCKLYNIDVQSLPK